MRNRNVAAVCVLAIGIAAAGAAALWSSVQTGDRSHRIAVASVRQPATGLVAFAVASGCLADAGVEIDEHAFDLGRDALVLLGDGRVEVAVAYETPALRAAFEDQRLRIVSELHRSTENTRLVARRDHGVDEVADLRGRRVGVAAGTNAEFFLDALLRFEGLRDADAIVVDVEPAVAVERLLAGTLDAVALADPFAHRAEIGLGVEAVVLNTEVYVEASLLVTRDDVLEARRPALEALLRGLACAERRARERSDAVLAAMRARLPETTERELARQLSRVEWGLSLDHVLLDVLRREREWLDRRGTPGTPPELARLVEPALLESAVPGAVLLLPGG